MEEGGKMSSMRYWESTSNDEYLDHLKKMEKAPTMHPDIPLYPNAYCVFKNKLSYEGKESSMNRQYTESQKKVQFAESNKNDKEKPKNFQLHKWRTFKV